MRFNKIMVYGNPILRQRSPEIETIDQQTKEIVGAMFTAMAKAGGIGLAAPQVGINQRIVVLDINEYEKSPKLALINPVLSSWSRMTKSSEEGCLSVPGIRGDVSRWTKIQVEALDQDGHVVQLTARDLLARVIQHEMDHLDGVLFVDKLDSSLSPAEQNQLKKISTLGTVPIV